jgi:hypothetical protein
MGAGKTKIRRDEHEMLPLSIVCCGTMHTFITDIARIAGAMKLIFVMLSIATSLPKCFLYVRFLNDRS